MYSVYRTAYSISRTEEEDTRLSNFDVQGIPYSIEYKWDRRRRRRGGCITWHARSTLTARFLYFRKTHRLLVAAARLAFNAHYMTLLLVRQTRCCINKHTASLTGEKRRMHWLFYPLPDILDSNFLDVWMQEPRWFLAQGLVICGGSF